MRWFDRKFEFTYPPGVHATVVERLRGLLPRLEAKLAVHAGVDFTVRIDGTWSMQENVGHLLDLEPLWTRRVEQFDEGVEVLAAADLENTKTHEANHNEADLDRIVADLRRARTALVDHLAGLDADGFARTSRHPRLDQSMRLIDHVLFVAEHDDHHLARIEAIARGLAAV